MEISAGINIDPQPALRPWRKRNGHVYTDPKYRNYQEKLISAIKEFKFSPGNYVHLEAIFFVSKKPKGELIQEKPDADNYCKALKDCLSKAGILKRKLKKPYKNKKGEMITHSYDDSLIATEHVCKIGNGDDPGFIVFRLMEHEEYFSKYGNPRDLFQV